MVVVRTLLVVVALTGLVSCGNSSSSSEAEAEQVPDRAEVSDDLDRAAAICQEHRSVNPELAANDGSVAASATTVGQMQVVLDALGEDPISEWATRPDDDFIAACTYPLPTDYTGAPTTICADGSTVVLADPNQIHLLVDEDGNSVPDRSQSAVPTERSPACP